MLCHTTLCILRYVTLYHAYYVTLHYVSGQETQQPSELGLPGREGGADTETCCSGCIASCGRMGRLFVCAASVWSIVVTSPSSLIIM